MTDRIQRPDIFRFRNTAYPLAFDPDCETLQEWAAREFCSAPIKVHVNELRLAPRGAAWLRIVDVTDADQTLYVAPDPSSSRTDAIAAGELVGQVLAPHTNVSSNTDSVILTVVVASDSVLASPPKREVPQAASRAAVASYTLDAPVDLELLGQLLDGDDQTADAQAALVVFHGWSITAAMMAGSEALDILSNEANKDIVTSTGGVGLLGATRTSRVYDRMASWCVMAHVAVIEEVVRLHKIQDLLRIRAGLDPYFCGPLALYGERHTIADAEAAEAENTPRWAKHHLISEEVSARAVVARARMDVVDAAQAAHASAHTDGERWSIGGAEHKALDLAVDGLNFAEQRLMEAQEKAEGYVD